MKQKENYDLTPINLKIAFSIFRDWTAAMSINYPELDFEIIDETVLLHDLKHCLNNGLKSLYSNKKFWDSKMLRNWDIGFLMGYLEGNLLKHWVYEYITKQGEDYKIFSMLKSLSMFLDFDKMTEIKLDTIYEKLVKEDSNLANNSIDVHVKEILIEKKIKEVVSDERGKTKALIDNLKNKYILKVVNFEVEEMSFDASKYIRDYEFEELIKLNRPQNKPKFLGN
jgi:hypothetical protein